MQASSKGISIGAAVLFGLILIAALATLALIDRPGIRDDVAPLIAAAAALIGLAYTGSKFINQSGTVAELVSRAERLRDAFLRYSDDARAGVRTGERSAVEAAMVEAQPVLDDLRTAERYQIARDLLDAMRQALLATSPSKQLGGETRSNS